MGNLLILMLVAVVVVVVAEIDLLSFERTCKDQPGAYLRAVLSLVPKDFALTVERAEYPKYIELRFTDTPD